MTRRLFFVISLLVLFSPLMVEAAFRWPWQTAKPLASSPAPTNDNVAALKSGNEKIQRWEKLVESKTTRAGEKYAAEFSQAELEAIARDTISKLKQSSLEPSGFSVKVGEEKVTVVGQVLKPVSFNIKVVLEAAVVDGKLVPEVKSGRVGVLPVGGHIVERFANEIFGGAWRQELNHKGFVWDEIILSEGKAYVAGHTVKVKK